MSFLFCIFATMNEQVVDISKTLKELAYELNSMRQTVDSQHAEICQLNRKVQAQSKDIRHSKRKMPRYAVVYPSMNSHQKTAIIAVLHQARRI